MYHTVTVGLRHVAAAAIVAAGAGCLPAPQHPNGHFDSGPPIVFDAVAWDAGSPADDVAAPADMPREAAHDVIALPDAPVDAPRSDGPDPSRRYPSPPYGEGVGAVLLPFQLADCAGGTYRFDGADWLAARATFLVVTAGYCTGCAADDQLVQQRIAAPYRNAGLRVVGVLTEGASPGDPPTAAFCASWIADNHLAHPMALDLGGMLRANIAGVALPQWILTDDLGRIVWRGAGSAAALGEAQRQVEALLAASP